MIRGQTVKIFPEFIHNVITKICPKTITSASKFVIKYYKSLLVSVLRISIVLHNKSS